MENAHSQAKYIPTPNKPRQRGDRQSPEARVKNFTEVAGNYTWDQAKAEANRCLNCKDAPCAKACPVNVQIPQFISFIREGKAGEAASKIMETNLLPAICGRVCPQEHHCEGACVLGKKFEPIAVGMLEKFSADTARRQNEMRAPVCTMPSGKKVACIGSGPSSLVAAAELARNGHKVTIFEALHAFGGVLRYGIPSFRLPRNVIDAEIKTVSEMCVEFRTDVLVGSTVTVGELLKEFDAVYVGSGAGLPTMMNIEGEGLAGVYSANEFLTRVNLMHADRFPETDTPVIVGKHVVVVGGGNSAMDSARCARRLGPDTVTVVYRRSQAEMPARKEEVENAQEEGVKFEFLTAPIGLEGDEKGIIKRIKCIRMALGEPDASGRRRPVPQKGSEFYIEADCVIVAIGQRPNPIIQKTTPGLETGKEGVVIVNDSGKTALDGVFAGGDVIRGGATVLVAMKDGKTAAAAIHNYLTGKKNA